MPAPNQPQTGGKKGFSPLQKYKKRNCSTTTGMLYCPNMISFIEKLKETCPNLIRNQKGLFLLITIITGFFALLPLCDFQYYLAQGDHGRDLYCFQQTMQGAMPYRDYSWVLGPLMPYYYSVFFTIFGVSAQSALLGQTFLAFIIGITLYLTCSLFLSRPLSFIVALFYWTFRGTEFFYTYVHIGGLAALMATIYFLLKYLKNNRAVHIYAGFLCLFILMLIRLNIGISSLVGFLACLSLIDKFNKPANFKKNILRNLSISLGILAATGIIYWILLKPLPSYALHQCFPYSKSHRTDLSPSILGTLPLLWNFSIGFFTSSAAHSAFGLLTLFFIWLASSVLSRNQIAASEKKENLLAISCLFIFLILNLHEFILSGVYYRLNWIYPVFTLIIFFIIHVGLKKTPSRLIHCLLLTTFIGGAFFHLHRQNFNIIASKGRHNILDIGKTKIYTWQTPDWFYAVYATTDFLNKNLAEDETFFALPFDPLYYFLTEKKSPTRQLIFFEHKNIPEEQELDIIQKLETQKVNYIIISNRASSPGESLGILGRDYCPLLFKYIEENFGVVTTIGEWARPAGWAWNHSIRILRRKF